MAAGHRRAQKRTLVIGDCLGYATTFVGAGLTSGAVVHHPLDPDRYTMIALVGAVVFLCATPLNEFVLKRQRPSASTVVAIVLASLALSFGIGIGIGMLSGGLQHFEDFPERAAMLIPFGLALSFVRYLLRYDATRWRSNIKARPGCWCWAPLRSRSSGCAVSPPTWPRSPAVAATTTAGRARPHRDGGNGGARKQPERGRRN
ncbi:MULTISPECIES: hypothetical protein [unclassified Streptomyces]|uniref:hypothetical protein n=1 Tax=unclassified Streptomyces TaxID=2593676 RepID=UPI0033A1A3EE